jgi:hypothetical protein
MSISGESNMKPLFEIVGALAVLVGLIFVGMELRQNTAAVQAATFQDLIHASSDFLVDIGSDPETQRIYAIGRLDPGALTPDEHRQYVSIQQAFWLRMQNAFMQWRRGTLIDEDWIVYQSIICESASVPGPEAHWRSAPGYAPSFKELLEACDESR